MTRGYGYPGESPGVARGNTPPATVILNAALAEERAWDEADAAREKRAERAEARSRATGARRLVFDALDDGRTTPGRAEALMARAEGRVVQENGVGVVKQRRQVERCQHCGGVKSGPGPHGVRLVKEVKGWVKKDCAGRPV